MQDIELSNVSLNYGFSKSVLDGATMTVNSGEKVALVGDNGTGKTSILRLIAGEETPSLGTVSKRRDATIGYLRQTPMSVNGDLTVRQFIEYQNGELGKLAFKLHELETKLAESSFSPKQMELIMQEYGNVQAKFMDLDGYSISSKIDKVAADMGITELLDQNFNDLSGGQKTIVSLATTLLSHPDILLLDEPTNHLDIQMLEGLQRLVKNYPGSVILISHDRYFLDQTVDRVISIQDGKLKSYPGNYTDFVEAYEAERELQAQAYVTQQKQIEGMKDTIRKNRAWGAASSEKAYRVAKQLERRIEEMDKVERPKTQRDIPLSFTQESRSGNDVLRLEDVFFSYGEGAEEQPILMGANLGVQYGDRVCLVGKNGSGKSTILKLILGELEAQEGKVETGSNVKVGYLPQQVTFDSEDVTLLEEFSKHCTGGQTQVRSTLAAYGFKSDDVFKRISSLSGGEKVRLKFAELVQDDVDLLILDEPTNHLDIRSREALEKALAEFAGTEIFVSHDRYFINKVANRVAELEDGELTDFIGNYDEYREQKARSNPFSGPGGGTGPSKSGGPQKVLRRVQDSSRRP